VIFVDAGSLDGTGEYLAGVAAAAPVRVEVVRSTSEADFSALVREGLAMVRGSLVVWINNDVLVPELWLLQLAALATSNPAIGMVGPMANVAPDPQRIEQVLYRIRRGSSVVGGCASEPPVGWATKGFDDFARQFREKNKGQWTEVDRLGGFCFGIKREVIAKAPLLTEKQDEVVLDGSRLSALVRRAGHRLVCCRDLFVHHIGSYLTHERESRMM
jgi:GT2 family glycosyltransferase